MLSAAVVREHLLEPNAERSGDAKRNLERRRVLAELDRVDRLPRDADALRQSCCVISLRSKRSLRIVLVMAV